MDLRVVLHGAGAQADVDVEVRADGLLGQAQIVPQQLHLTQLRQLGGFPAEVALGHQVVRRTGGLGDLRLYLLQQKGPLAGLSQFHQNGFVPSGFVEITCAVPFHAPVPPKISCSAAHKVSMSAAVVVSLTQYRA